MARSGRRPGRRRRCGSAPPGYGCRGGGVGCNQGGRPDEHAAGPVKHAHMQARHDAGRHSFPLRLPADGGAGKGRAACAGSAAAGARRGAQLPRNLQVAKCVEAMCSEACSNQARFRLAPCKLAGSRHQVAAAGREQHSSGVLVLATASAWSHVRAYLAGGHGCLLPGAGGRRGAPAGGPREPRLSR